ncbi:uncharacterized protein LOC129589868 isoform X2 [Paramacrobiotus metropolitanus]|uniref:uncharacterized protein LOC129589868 isoform X2 n=1 Tax=Paramacrobiotus metropolitanus TaxID=2943436 RepID=UPI0024459DCF|nr:uncharacterized protein LOC129589868 isoform X2 [Paramacrobiotus metropolitanus]
MPRIATLVLLVFCNSLVIMAKLSPSKPGDNESRTIALQAFVGGLDASNKPPALHCGVSPGTLVNLQVNSYQTEKQKDGTLYVMKM